MRSSVLGLMLLGVCACSTDSQSSDGEPRRRAEAPTTQSPSRTSAFPPRTTERSFSSPLPHDAALHVDGNGIWLEDEETGMKVHVAPPPPSDGAGVLPQLASKLKSAAISKRSSSAAIRLDIEAAVPASTVRRVMTTVRALGFSGTRIAFASADGSTTYLSTSLDSPFGEWPKCGDVTKVRVLPAGRVQIYDGDPQPVAELVEQASLHMLASCLHVELADPTTFADLAPLLEGVLDEDGSTVLLVHSPALDEDPAASQRQEARALWDEVQAAREGAGERSCVEKLAEANAALDDGDRAPDELRLLAIIQRGCGTRHERLATLRELTRVEPREVDSWTRLGEAEFSTAFTIDLRPEPLIEEFGSHLEAVAANTRAIEAYEKAESLAPDDAKVLLALHWLHKTRARVIRKTAAIEKAREQAKTYLGKACKASSKISVCAEGGRDCCPP